MEQTDSRVKVRLGCRGSRLKTHAHQQLTQIHQVIVAAHLFNTDEIKSLPWRNFTASKHSLWEASTIEYFTGCVVKFMPQVSNSSSDALEL